MCTYNNSQYGASPINIQWKVVRGDTAKLKIQFLENDEATVFDTDGWQYVATSYDPSGDVLDNLDVIVQDGFIEIVAPASITENWGTKYSAIVAELSFDLQIKMGTEVGSDIWTPIIGTISVLGDISPRSGLC